MSFHLVYLFIRRRLQEIDWGPVLDRKDRAGAGKYSAEKKKKEEMELHLLGILRREFLKSQKG